MKVDFMSGFLPIKKHHIKNYPMINQDVLVLMGGHNSWIVDHRYN